MRFSKRVVSRLSLALTIVASTLAITCASGGGGIPNESVQLTQIRGVEAKLDRLLDVGIRTQLAGGRSGIVADEFASGNPNGEIDESGRQIIFRQKLAIGQKLTGVEVTTQNLQRLRAGLHLRVDEAYAARGDLSKFSDLTSLTAGADGFAQSINAPAQIQGIGR
jgi:hypothetical protein